MTEQEALLVLNACASLGATRARQLIGYFGSGVNVLQASLDQLRASQLLVSQTAENIFHFNKDKFLQNEYNLMRQKHVRVVTCVDADFPVCFKDFEDAPIVLYVKGSIACFKSKALALVGSRAASFQGCRSAKKFAQAFAREGVVVVSGLARGIDTAAHEGALEAGGQTIAVIGCGFNYMYPQENRALMEKIAQSAAVISEFSFAMPPLRHNFPWRNRIISALSQAIVVVEAGKKSGALITADYAIAQNKEVFVLPSHIDVETALGSNQLIQEGAKVALCPQDVLAQMHPEDLFARASFPVKPQRIFDETEQQVYACLSDQPIHLDDLAAQVRMNVGLLMGVLLRLELKHAIRQLPGQYYVRNEHG